MLLIVIRILYAVVCAGAVAAFVSSTDADPPQSIRNYPFISFVLLLALLIAACTHHAGVLKRYDDSKPIAGSEQFDPAAKVSWTLKLDYSAPGSTVRGTIAAVVSAAAPVSTRRRDSSLVVTIFLPAGLLFVAKG